MPDFLLYIDLLYIYYTKNLSLVFWYSLPENADFPDFYIRPPEYPRTMATDPYNVWLTARQLEDIAKWDEEDPQWRTRMYPVGITGTKEKLESAGRWYFVTYTQPDTDKTPDRLIRSCKRLLKSKAVSPTMWAYSIELTKTGTPHAHVRFFTNKYPDFKKCVGAFNDGYRYDCQSEKFNSGDYLVKQESKPTKEWLDSVNLESWWYQSDNYNGATPESALESENLISHV